MADDAAVDETPEWKVLQHLLLAAVERSVTSAAGSGRTVSDPAKAAEYVTNMLTVHRPDLLAALAVQFAGPQVKALTETPEDEAISEIGRWMRRAVLTHKQSLAPPLDRYWQVPDANHSRLLATAALAALRSLPVAQRAAELGFEPDTIECGEHYDGKHWIEA